MEDLSEDYSRLSSSDSHPVTTEVGIGAPLLVRCSFNAGLWDCDYQSPVVQPSSDISHCRSYESYFENDYFFHFSIGSQSDSGLDYDEKFRSGLYLISHPSCELDEAFIRSSLPNAVDQNAFSIDLGELNLSLAQWSQNEEEGNINLSEICPCPDKTCFHNKHLRPCSAYVEKCRKSTNLNGKTSSESINALMMVGKQTGNEEVSSISVDQHKPTLEEQSENEEWLERGVSKLKINDYQHQTRFVLPEQCFSSVGFNQQEQVFTNGDSEDSNLISCQLILKGILGD